MVLCLSQLVSSVSSGELLGLSPVSLVWFSCLPLSCSAIDQSASLLTQSQRHMFTLTYSCIPKGTWENTHICMHTCTKRVCFEKSLRNLPCLAWPYFSVIYLILFLLLLLLLCSTSFYSVLWLDSPRDLLILLCSRRPFLSSLPSSLFLTSSWIRIFWSMCPGGGVAGSCKGWFMWVEDTVTEERSWCLTRWLFGNNRKICPTRAPGRLYYARSVLSDRHWRNPAGKEPESFSLSKPHGLLEGHAAKEAEPRWRIGCGDRTERKHELVGFQAKGGSWPTKRGVTRVTVCPGTISMGPVAGWRCQPLSTHL